MIYQALIRHSKEHPDPSQKVFIEVIKGELDIGRTRSLSLLRRGEGRFWRSYVVRKANNQRVYSPILEGE